MTHAYLHRTFEYVDAAQNMANVEVRITFNYSQPAEDAVDEALTGLKASLDVKVFGTDLSILESKGRAIKAVIARAAQSLTASFAWLVAPRPAKSPAPARTAELHRLPIRRLGAPSRL